MAKTEDDWSDVMGLQYNRPLSKGVIIDGRNGRWYPVGGTSLSEFTAQEINDLNEQASEARADYEARRIKMHLMYMKHMNNWAIIKVGPDFHYPVNAIVVVGNKLAQVMAIDGEEVYLRPLKWNETLIQHIKRWWSWLKKSFILK